ncbi:MAG: PadR family transcriptional regulator [Candidatus Bathyarchaeota archaeon]|nr:PadR family transcriptional regulator [Candidatus Bathyarchaeota archaeon A05DMB-3]MDH7607435.1 PadR family transcriptional regulator [Candidatus Bathyarchaeota archaeon]
MFHEDENYPPPPPLPPFRHWLRHMAAVPKGFLRYQVLELLNEKPLSGSEIMSEIEKRTNGCWKPSPGSVYPLLAWLQDNGYICEVPSEESGIRRYTLTDKGKKLLEEQRKVRVQFRTGRKLFVPPLFGSLWLHIPPEEADEVREAFRRLFKAFFSLGMSLEEKFSQQVLKDTLKVLNETAQRLEEIDKKLRDEKA